MKATDTPPCPHCGGPLAETPPDADATRWDYDCAACAWHGEYPARLTLADAPWTRGVWAEVERLRAGLARLERILAVERGDQSAAPEGWVRTESSWCRGSLAAWRSQMGRWGWSTDWDGGAAPTALEAMEAADRAAKEAK